MRTARVTIENVEGVPNKTIAKFWIFVIFAAFGASLGPSCVFGPHQAPGAPVATYDKPRVIGTVASPEITESSGLAASRCQADVLWTHNDSGDNAFIFAIDKKGRDLGTWRVPDATNIDWEDVATARGPDGRCLLYIGEIGDNKSRRAGHAIYRIAEPLIDPAASASSRKQPQPTGPADKLLFKYPDFDQDAETLMVRPDTGELYIITKRVSGPAGVYKLTPSFDPETVQEARYVSDLTVPSIPNGFLTGGDIAPDGRRVVVCDYARAYELRLPEKSRNFDEIWHQTIEPVELGPRKAGEAVAYSADGNSIFATSEMRNSPLIEVRRR